MGKGLVQASHSASVMGHPSGIPALWPILPVCGAAVVDWSIN
jgi:hypothetical protein